MMLPQNLIPRIEFAVQSLFRRQKLCPFCESENHKIVARKNGVVRVRRCQRCFLYFTDPTYRSYVGDLYDSLYQAEGSTTALPDAATLESLVRTNFAASDKNCATQIEALKRLTSGRDLLEIGSSWGYFLRQAAVAGFAARGIEPAATRRRFGVRELGAYIRASIDELGDARFDVVYCTHTLEHITEAGRFFVSCRDRLREGGVLAIEVPHFDLETLGKAVLPVIGAVHPLGLSPSFFRFALPQAGFTVVGVYDDWASVPSRPMAVPREGNLIAIAEKRSTPAVP